MTNDIPLVWIEMGRKLPPYLIANINLHRELLPHHQQILLTDQTLNRKMYSRLKLLGVSVVTHDSPKDYLSMRIKRTTGQLGFWINTTYRFLVLEEFMKKKKIKQVIHQESDSVILEIKYIDRVFETPDWGLAYPLQAMKLGCASIFLVNELTSLAEFNNFVKNSWEEVNQDDMKLLGVFSARKDVKALPSTPDFDVVFDPGTYGRYLLGTDARNRRYPFSRRGISDDRFGAISIENERITFQLSSESSSLLICRDSKVSKLVNLHIHSKRIPASRAALNRMISHDIKSMGTRTWVIGRIDLRVFSERLFSWTLSRILRRDKDVRLR